MGAMSEHQLEQASNEKIAHILGLEYEEFMGLSEVIRDKLFKVAQDMEADFEQYELFEEACEKDD